MMELLNVIDDIC